MNGKTVPQPRVNSTEVEHTFERKRTGALLFASSCVVLAALALYAADSNTENDSAREIREREAMRDLLPRLRTLEEVRSTDAAIQLGLAIIYRKYDRSKAYSDRGKAAFERVLELGPGHKIVWAIRAEETTLLGVALKKRLVERLEAVIENAKGRGATEIFIIAGPPINIKSIDPAQTGTWHNPLYDILGDGTGKRVIIDEKDYDQARAKVQQRANIGLKEAIDPVEQAEKHDPNNALHNYLKANLHFELGQVALAMQELRTAVRKPSVNRYHKERQIAIAKALEAADVPSTLRPRVERVSPVGDYLRGWIWRPFLEPLEQQSEEDRDFVQAREICDLLMGMAKHVREEPLPYVSSYNKMVSDAMDRWAQERLSSVAQRAEPPQKLPASPPQD